VVLVADLELLNMDTLLAVVSVIAGAWWLVRVKTAAAEQRVAFWRDAYCGEVTRNSAAADALDDLRKTAPVR
jgi:hypothetical protein